MKILTKSQNGIVVEFSDMEYRELNKLIQSVEGKTFDDVYSSGFIREPYFTDKELDLSTIFGAIEAFYSSKFRINEIQKGLNILKSAVEKIDA